MTWFEFPFGNTFPLKLSIPRAHSILETPTERKEEVLEHGLQLHMLKSFRFSSAHNSLQPESVTRYDTVHQEFMALPTQK